MRMVLRSLKSTQKDQFDFENDSDQQSDEKDPSFEPNKRQKKALDKKTQNQSKQPTKTLKASQM